MKWTDSFKTIVLLFSAGLIACSSGQEETMPTNLTELKALYEKKQSELRSLNTDIAEIEKALAKLDTTQHPTAKTLVTTTQLMPVEFEHFIKIQGNVQADEAVNASSEMGGRILNLKVKEGQQVSRGALIAVLDAETILKQKAEIETALQLARE